MIGTGLSMMKYFSLSFALLLQMLYTSHLQPNCLEIYSECKQGTLVIGKAVNANEVMCNGIKLLKNDDGYFVFGIDRDDTLPICISAKFIDGSIDSIICQPIKRKYDIQRLTVEEKFVFPPKEELNRIERESEIITQARANLDKTNTMYFLNGFELPLSNAPITSLFGSQRILNGVPKSPHNGVDLKAPTGTPVKSMADGKVVLCGENFYYGGYLIIIDHGHGVTSTYLHLAKILVEEGQMVKKGEIIGKVGSTGRSTGPHLHWGVQWYQKRIDPLSVFKSIEFLYQTPTKN